MGLEHDRHHLYWPRRNYTSSLERLFRGLPCNIRVMLVQEHRLLHITTPPPVKPTATAMRNAIRQHRTRECGCQ